MVCKKFPVKIVEKFCRKMLKITNFYQKWLQIPQILLNVRNHQKITSDLHKNFVTNWSPEITDLVINHQTWQHWLRFFYQSKEGRDSVIHFRNLCYFVSRNLTQPHVIFRNFYREIEFTKSFKFKYQTIFRSKTFRPSYSLSNLNRVRSIVWKPSSTINSIKALPNAGAYIRSERVMKITFTRFHFKWHTCWIPCPLQPVINHRFLTMGWLPIIAFWSQVL